MIKAPPLDFPLQDSRGYVNLAWQEFFSAAYLLMADMQRSGTTANRPTKNLYPGKPYFDTTLGHPIWHSGTDWVDATGAVV